jgi:hypothetical protein
VDYQVDAGIVMAILAEKARSEPLLAAWLEAAQWQAVAVTQNQNGDHPDATLSNQFATETDE